MALQFYFGASGAGKSRQLHNDLIKESKADPRKQFLLIVPDQFTMQTQMDLVLEHPDHGILNIDVLSFGRLTYRVLEEVGKADVPVLDDTGKSLILKKVASKVESQLGSLSGNLSKIGYIHEVKSALSEFMQYGISPDDVEKLISYAQLRGALQQKLKDLNVLYRAFLKEIGERFVTKEEKLDLLTKNLAKSRIIQGSVIAFDGFTGFTPIQYRVIEELLVLAKQVKITVLLDLKEDPYQMCGEQKLFYLSKKTIYDIKKIADRVSVPEVAPVYIRGENRRLLHNRELDHLEQNLFRGKNCVYKEATENIIISECANMEIEIKQVCANIRKLLSEEKLCFRDIAVISGNMNTYAYDLERIFRDYELPVYMDNTRSILLNPFIEYIRSAAGVVLKDFSFEAVFHFLRCGFCPIEKEKVDLLENYVRKTGIRGRKRWESPFAAKGKKETDEAFIKKLEALNETRETVLTMLAGMLRKGKNCREYVEGIYQFLTDAESEARLLAFSERYEQLHDEQKAKEYSQIYRYVIDLLDQIVLLLGEEEMSFEELFQILEAGFSEIRVGTIPQDVDRILVGDMERTRIKQVKVLFVLGVNDGNIPAAVNKGGLLSDIDREFLQKSEFELAPTPRQQMFIQRLYLYMNLTRPKEKLFISYPLMNQAGTSLRPSYLIEMLRSIFPAVRFQVYDEESERNLLVGSSDVLSLFSDRIRDYSFGGLSDTEEGQMAALAHVLKEKEPELLQKLEEVAFYYYEDKPLAKAVAENLYGTILSGSVSRMETYKACAYAHFLRYGMWLRERESFEFEPVDMGNIYHEILEKFSNGLPNDHFTWFDFTKEYAEARIDLLLEECAAGYGDGILYSSARNHRMIRRMSRILKRTVLTLKEQVSKGKFQPEHFELGFQRIYDIDSLDLSGTEEKVKLRGRIDRVDTCMDDDHVYVKIIDYKSGNKKMDLAAVYYGLNLQLVIYLNAAMENCKKKHPEKDIVPAAMLYYQVSDPAVEITDEALTADDIQRMITEQLKMNGMVNSDQPIVELLDQNMTGPSSQSSVIPVGRKKDGNFTSTSKVMSTEEINFVSSYVENKIADWGKEILNGKISIAPCDENVARYAACEYCDYRSVCMFHSKLKGFSEQKTEALSKESALMKMRQSMKKEEKGVGENE